MTSASVSSTMSLSIRLDPGIDVVRAGLIVDVENPDVLVIAARTLLEGGNGRSIWFGRAGKA